MKILLFSLLLFFSIVNDKGNVYICVSKTAHKYHYREDCRGLNNCKHTISKVSLKEAKNAGYTICGWEY